MLYAYVITGGHDYMVESLDVTISAVEIIVPYNISIHNDNVFEANESFILTIDSSSVPSRVIVQPDCVTVVTIVDDCEGKLYILCMKVQYCIVKMFKGQNICG